MAKNPVTASERRGILVVAALALLIIGTAFLTNRCDRSSLPTPPPEVKTVTLPDTLSPDSLQTAGKKIRKGGKNHTDSLRRKKKGRKGKAKKTYRTRSPLDEPV